MTTRSSAMAFSAFDPTKLPAIKQRRALRNRALASLDTHEIALESLESRILMSTTSFSLLSSPEVISPVRSSLGGESTAVIIRSSSAVSTGSNTATSIEVTSTSTSNLSSFTIIINAGAGLVSNTAALAAFQRAAAQWTSRISDDVTVTIDADLANLGSASIIGQTGSVSLTAGYDLIRNQMVADAADESDDGITNFLPTASQVSYILPTGFSTNGNLVGTKANLKAMGFTGLDAQFGASDAEITFNSQFSFDFDNSNGITSGTMDFETVAAHEIGHALGFISNVDTVDFYLSRNQSVSFAPTTLDLYRFGNGTANDPETNAQFTTFSRDLRTGASGVAAITDQISTWANAAAETLMSTGSSTGDGRQASHWKDSLGLGLLDPTLSYGELVLISDADLRALDLIGWDIALPGGDPNNGQPVAVNDTGSASEDSVLIVGAAQGVLVNDSDPDGDTVSVISFSGTSAQGAIITMAADGSYSYDPTAVAALQALAAGQSLQDTFSYTIGDGNGGTASASVTITVNGLNDAPVATDDAFSIAKKTNTATGDVLSNDSDVDGSSLTAQLVSGPTNGTLTLNLNGTFTYTPGSSFNGSDTFTYQAVDASNALSNIATVTIGKSGGGKTGGGSTGGGGNGGGGPRPRLTSDFTVEPEIQAKLNGAMAAYSVLVSSPAIGKVSSTPAWAVISADAENEADELGWKN